MVCPHFTKRFLLLSSSTTLKPCLSTHIYCCLDVLIHVVSPSRVPFVLQGFFVGFFPCLFRAAPEVCGGAQARGRIGAAVAGLRHSRRIQAAPATYPTAHGSAGPSAP